MRQLKQVLATVAVGLLGLCLLPASGVAAPLPFSFAFPEDGTSGVGAGQLGNLRGGLAADNASGDVYVGEVLSDRISVFSVRGRFLRAWGWGVRDGSSELQVCTLETGCQAGTPGPNAGQLSQPLNLTVDDAGNVYVFDFGNRRVQKYSPEGEFVLMFGGGVNVTTGADVCTRQDLEDGDECGAGSAGDAQGEFNPFISADIAYSPVADAIFVIESDRIQRFSVDGTFEDELPFPEAGDASRIAVDPVSGDLFVSRSWEFLDTSVPLYRMDAETGAVVDQIDVGDPTAEPFPIFGAPEEIAVAGNGTVYTIVSQQQVTKQNWLEVIALNASGVCVQGMCPGNEFARAGAGEPARLATSSACGVPTDILYLGRSNPGVNQVSAYGPPPSPAICPDPFSQAPVIVDQHAASVDTRGAVVRAAINPRFETDATYYVEYGVEPCAQGGCQSTPPPPGSLLTDESVSFAVPTAGIFLGGLKPNTTYRYRFVAESGGGGPVKGKGGAEGFDGEEGAFTTLPIAEAVKTDCPNQALRIGRAALLSDCRAYEMVSPVNKENGDVFALRTSVSGPAALVQSTAGAGKLTYSSYRAFGDDAQSAPWTSQYVATRGGAGWTSKGISSPREGLSIPVELRALDAQYKGFSADLCSGWFLQDSAPTLDPSAPAGFAALYRRDICDGGDYNALLRAEPQLTAAGRFWMELQGTSADGKCAVFRANGKLTPTASDELSNGEGVYQVYRSCGEDLQLVSVLPNGTASNLHSTGGTASGSRFYNRDHSVFRSLSADGTRVYWTEAGTFGSAPGTIYVRDNADQPQSALSGETCTEATKACTYRVSQTAGAGNAIFRVATPDGSQALFTLGGALYRFDFSGASSSSTLIAGGNARFLGASTDLTRIYLVSESVLDGGASAGTPNLYRYEGGSFAFIATLSATDVIDANVRSPVHKEPSKRTSRVSLDGDHVAFMSTARLTSYENTDLESGSPVAEVYLYDATAEGGDGRIVCVSCNPTGARSNARVMENSSSGGGAYRVAAQLPTWKTQHYPTRLLSDDGSRLFFESFERLVPRDHNSRLDVYEWSRASTGGACVARGAGIYVAAAAGCVSLVSSGDSRADSELLDASADGSTVFIATDSSLVAQDPGLIDVYAARVGGGFPQPAPARPPCEGDACQSPPAPPSDPTPGTATLGRGESSKGGKKRRCPKGTRVVKRRGKFQCVSKRKAKPKAKKHGKKGKQRQRSAAR